MDNDSKWNGFEDPAYKIVDLGRPAVFLIPTQKLTVKMPSGRTVKEELQMFLTISFGAFTTTQVPSFGVWHDESSTAIVDECIRYEVAFLGKGNIPKLLKKLSQIATVINETCLYVSAGQYTCLLFPTRFAPP